MDELSPTAVHVLVLGQLRLELRIGEGRPEQVGLRVFLHGTEVERSDLGWRGAAGVLSWASAIRSYATPPRGPEAGA